MTEPGDPGAPTVAPRGGPAAVGGQALRGALRALLVLLFLLRGALSLYEAAAATRPLQPVPLIDPLGYAAGASVWGVLWGVVAVAAAIALWRSHTLGWMLGLATAVAYLVSGISDVSMLDLAASVTQTVAVLLVELGIPLVVLAILSRARPTFRPIPVRALPAVPSPLERWRRRR